MLRYGLLMLMLAIGFTAPTSSFAGGSHGAVTKCGGGRCGGGQCGAQRRCGSRKRCGRGMRRFSTCGFKRCGRRC